MQEMKKYQDCQERLTGIKACTKTFQEHIEHTASRRVGEGRIEEGSYEKKDFINDSLGNNRIDQFLSA